MTYVPQQKVNLVIAAAAMAAPGAPAIPAARPRLHPRLRRVSRRSLVLALVAAAVPVTVTATVVELTDQPPPREAPLPTLGAGPDGRVIPRDPLAALPTAVGAVYSRLTRPATTAERGDAGIRNAAAHAKQFGLSADQARVMATVDGQRVWLIPGNGYLCIAVEPIGDDNGSGSCETQAVALKDGLSVSNADDIYGILPDGITQIDVTDDTGLHHVESVVDNVYVLPPVSATIRYRSADGQTVGFRVIG
jgi:hypothetical protein